MKQFFISTLSILSLVLFSLQLSAQTPPTPFGPVPSERQMKWHELESYCFVHFTITTFYDRDWGQGDEDNSKFNPTNFDANQIVETAKAGGLKGLILTAKHHDGFCLWPSKYTEHSVKNSPWRNGKGDMVREFADACKRHGLKFGIYLSPWDRNHAEYGRPGYITYFQNQLRELLTNYGPVFEVWFDGANGGLGYYGGANERRQIDTSYYQWDKMHSIIRELQPNACIWSDFGPDVRWIGNESGVTKEHVWATLDKTKDPNDFIMGRSNAKRLAQGDYPGSQWTPAEVNFSIRPSWFFHENENEKVRSSANIADCYIRSVGRNCSMLINLPPDKSGRIHENDVKALKGYKDIIDSAFAVNYALDAKIKASNTRGKKYGVQNLIDGNRNTYWATDDTARTPELNVILKKPATFSMIGLREYFPLGQRVSGYEIDVRVNGVWKNVVKGTGIGSWQLSRIQKVTASELRIRFTKISACPAISEFELYLEPESSRKITKAAITPGYEVGLLRKGWKVVEPADNGSASRAIDNNPNSNYICKLSTQKYLTIDLGKEQSFAGLLYLPRQDDSSEGIVDQYEVYVSNDLNSWGEAIAKGEFANIKAMPLQQKVRFGKPVTGRYVRFVASNTISDSPMSIADIGLIEE